MMGHARRVRLVQACLAGAALGSLLVGTIGVKVYRKDLQVQYLTAWALRDGLDPFTPLTVLSARYFPVAADNFPHPSPHPPFLALVSLPLTLIPFPAIVPLWLLLNLALLVVIGRCLGLSIQASLPLAAWPPLWCLLYIGQLELVILALAMLGWRAAAADRDWRAGLWLGLAAVIKLYPALLLVPYAVRRRGRILLAAVCVFLLSQLGNLIVVGPAGEVRYYREILPTVSSEYVHLSLNSAPYGALLRLFGGATDVPPLVDAPAVVLPVTVALSAFALFALVTLEPDAAPVAMLVALPAVWYYCVVLALPQMVTLMRRSDLRWAVLPAVVAASYVLPLVNFTLAWWGRAAPHMAAVLSVVQPAGFIGLLVLSLLGGRKGGVGNRVTRAESHVGELVRTNTI
jgi:hypothetical protein